MIKKLKKGFTLVELIVVIAIIAILSIVAVVGYTRIVDKANVSNDTQLVRNLNERMQLEEAANGYKKPETAHEAFVLTEDFGFIIEKLTPTSSGNDIVWDITTNRFALIDATDVEKVIYSDPQVTLSTKPVDLWKVYKEVPIRDDQKYSIYLASKENVNDEVKVKVGFDAGDTTNSPKVTYENKGVAQNVVIRTNGGALVIEAPLDTVEHYGSAETVDVVAIASASYHVHGKVGFFKMQSGHAVVESGAYIEVVYKTTAASTITTKKNSVINNAFASSEASASNGTNELVFTVTEKAEDVLKTEAKEEFELYVKLDAGCVAKSGTEYYMTLAEAIKGSSTYVYVIADTAENVTLPATKILIVEDGVNYTGTVDGLSVEIEADKEVYVASFDKAWSTYTSFSPNSKEVTIKLLTDVTIKQQKAVNRGTELTLDLNGKTISSQLSYNKTFLVKEDFNLCSGVEGAKILLDKAGFIQVSSDYPNSVVNVSNVEINAPAATTAVVLNYGTINFTNTAINAVNSTSSSAQLFTTYGDLTLSNTVVNVTGTLGTSLVNANGSAKVSIVGTTISVNTFRVNGGAFFSLANACSLELKNSKLNIGIDETYGSYLVNNNVAEKTVAIEKLTTNIVSKDGATTYVVDANTATWSKK